MKVGDSMERILSILATIFIVLAIAATFISVVAVILGVVYMETLAHFDYLYFLGN